MKLQIDTTKKTIKVEESINLDKFIETLNQFFPNEEWKDFKLETNVNINWTSPIVIKEPWQPYRYPWWQQPYVTWKNDVTVCDNTNNQYNLLSGVYNVEINT